MLSDKQKISIYQRMCQIRKFENRISENFRKGDIPGFVHLSVGQEGVSVGSCAALSEGDCLLTTHRGHGDLLAKGADINLLAAELYGKETGLNKGRGGSLHISDMAHTSIGANGIVGGGLPIAVGAALAQKFNNKGAVTICFFGDGAVNQGTFHESLNLASVWQVPVIFVCANNLYGGTTKFDYVSAVTDIASRATSYAIPAEKIDGNDVELVYETVFKAVENARKGGGPSLIECLTYRWKGHTEGEEAWGLTYRPDDEIAAWKKNDPILRFEEKLLAEGLLNENQVAGFKNEAQQQVEAAIDFAKQSASPDPETALDYLFA